MAQAAGAGNGIRDAPAAPAGSEESPARLEVIPIGNPLDVPVTVDVQLRTGGVTLKDVAFADRACAVPA